MREFYAKEHGDRAKAEEYLRKGVLMSKENPITHVELANFAFERNDPANAIRMLEAAITAEKNSEKMRAFFRNAIVKVRAGDTRRIRRPNME